MTNAYNIQLDGPVLAIDDDAEYRKELEEILTRHNLPSVFQETANHTLRYLQSQPWNWKPGVIITDIVMDGMGGYQLIRRIQELYPKSTIPIIVVSKLTAGVDVGEAEIAGAAAYLTKPLREDKLMQIMERVTTKDKKRMLVFTHDSGSRGLGGR